MEDSADNELIQMKVKGLMLDPTTDAPIVVLKDIDGSLFLPIWIGVLEANAIAISMEDVKVPRPMTHDLYVNTLRSLGAVIERIEVHTLIASTFYARIRLRIDGQEKVIDARPSDSIAIALRTGADIFVGKTVLENAKINTVVSDLSEDDKIKEILKNLDEEDLGDYTM